MGQPVVAAYREEVHVPDILKKDGVMANDFTHENQRVTNVFAVIAEHDTKSAWSRRIVNTESNSATLIAQLPGEGNRRHCHTTWNEWWYIVRGQWKWEIDQESVVVQEGDVVFIPKGHWHRITAIGTEPAIRLAVSREDVPHVYEG